MSAIDKLKRSDKHFEEGMLKFFETSNERLNKIKHSYNLKDFEELSKILKHEIHLLRSMYLASLSRGTITKDGKYDEVKLEKIMPVIMKELKALVDDF